MICVHMMLCPPFYTKNVSLLISYEKRTGTTKGTGGDAIILEEAAYVDQARPCLFVP